MYAGQTLKLALFIALGMLSAIYIFYCWLVIVVILYTAVTMLHAARTKQLEVPLPHQTAGE